MLRQVEKEVLIVLAVTAALGLLLALAGCDLVLGPQTTVLAPSQSVTQVTGTASPGTASPSPGTGGGAVHEVKVSGFGTETCSSGGVPAEAGDVVRDGCRQPITCTPTLLGGVDAVTPLGITAPDSFAVVSGSTYAQVEPSGVTPFNLDLRGVAPGVAVVRCVVRGVTGEKAFEVVP